jgi:hypothetical protein
MITRIIWTGKNNTMPRLRDLRWCSECGGTGDDYGYSNNPSEKPFKIKCTVCDGQGAIERVTS